MRLLFVRHGEPDYTNDCLTPTGRTQAEAAAVRLAGEGITEIYSSPNGRARETAECTAGLLGLPVTVLDYMHEISWGGEDVPDKGHPWGLSDRMMEEENFDFGHRDWREHPFFAKNAATECYDYVTSRFDRFMEERGYRQEGIRFYCEGAKDSTIAVFSHGGSGACVLSRLLSLPFPYVLTVFPYDYTSVIILDFPVRNGKYVHPRVELFNDTAHIRSRTGPQFQKKSE